MEIKVLKGEINIYNLIFNNFLICYFKMINSALGFMDDFFENAVFLLWSQAGEPGRGVAG